MGGWLRSGTGVGARAGGQRPARRMLLSCAACAVGITTPCIAAQFCAANPTQLAAALDNAEANAQNDDIRIVAGAHDLTVPMQFFSGEANSLVVSGGWNAGCTLKDGGLTVLDGGDLVRIMYLYSSAASAVTVSDLTFNSGHIGAGSNVGAGLSVQTTGNVTIERNAFVGNQSSYSAGGFFAGAGGTLVFRNNLALGNGAPYIGAGELICNGPSAYVTGNTIIGNTATNADGNGGLHVGGGAQFTLANNIIRSNSNWDLGNQALGGATLVRNDIGPHNGLPIAPDSADNVDIDPEFAPGFLDLHLAGWSPLVNAGADSPPGGIGIHDADGEPRLQGAHVDIGAYESDVLFYSGTDPRPATWP